MVSKVKTEKYELLESNVIYMDPEDSELLICLSLEEGKTISIYMRFREDKETGEYAIDAKIQGGALYITCTNFHNPLGTGTAKAIEVTESDVGRIYLHFWVYETGTKGTRRVEYDIFKER